MFLIYGIITLEKQLRMEVKKRKMKNEVILLGIAMMAFLSFDMAYAETIEECHFTAFIEHTWVMYGERPWVSGFVVGCDNPRWVHTDNELDYQLKDTIQVRFTDINGNLLTGHIADADNIPFSDEIEYSKYSFRDYVYRGGNLLAHQDAMVKGSQYIQENQFYFEFPLAVNSRDFEHRGIYHIELQYGDHKRIVTFASLNPAIHYMVMEPPKPDECIGHEDEIVRLQNLAESLEKDIQRQKGLDKSDKLLASQGYLEYIEAQITNLNQC